MDAVILLIVENVDKGLPFSAVGVGRLANQSNNVVYGTG